MLDSLDEDEKDPDLKLLSRDFRSSILKKFEKIQTADFYEILEIHPRATETEIRNAYLRLSKQFHPDRFFNKKLGHYKRKLEIIFSKIQYAHTILKDPIEREAVLKKMNLANDPKAQTKEKKSTLSTDQKRKLLDPEMERIGRAEHLYKQGLKLQEAKDYLGASNSFALAMQSNPKRAQYAQAFESIKPLMQLQKASENLEQAKKIIQAMGISADVLKMAEEALRFDPKLHEAQLIIGRCIVELNLISRMKDAKEMLLRAKAALSKNADAPFYLGRSLSALGDLQGAENAYREALRRDPRHIASKKYLEKDFGKN